MAEKEFLDFTGLQYYDTKLKASLAHPTHTYTLAANTAKNWFRIANASVSQINTAKPLHVQFMLTAWNETGLDHYQKWFVDCEVFGRNAGARIFGNSGAPFSQVRILYENTTADVDANDRPAIDIYLNNVLANAATNIVIEEIHNDNWTFVANGALSASTAPTGFESRASGVEPMGIARASNSTYTDYAALQRSNITANATLADNTTYRGRVLNCTNAITLTLPSINSVWAWFLIKNFNASGSGKNVTIHPSTTSVLIDDSNADIVLQPGEYVLLDSKAANSYTLLMDGRWKSADANSVHKTGDEAVAGVKTFSGEIKCTSANSIRLKGGNYGTFFRNDGSNTYILVTASGDADGSWTTARPLTIVNSTGVCSINGNAATATKATQDASGNVITTTYATKGELPADYVGATSSANGVHGLVPAAASANREKYLRGDGTWDNEVLVLSSDPTSSNAKTFNVVVSNDSIGTSAIPVTTTGNQTVGGQKTFTAGIYGGSITLASNVSTFDVSQAVCFTKTITANTTLAFSNVPADCVCCVSVILINGGNYAVTWPSGVKWTDNAVPALTRNGTDVLTFITCTGGTVWYGATACTGVTA